MKDKIRERLNGHIESIISKPELSSEDVSMLLFFWHEFDKMDERKENAEKMSEIMKGLAAFATV